MATTYLESVGARVCGSLRGVVGDGKMCAGAMQVLLRAVVGRAGGTFRFTRPDDFVWETFDVRCGGGAGAVPMDVPVTVRVDLWGQVHVSVGRHAPSSLTTLLAVFAAFCSATSRECMVAELSTRRRGHMVLRANAGLEGTDRARRQVAHAEACSLFLSGIGQLGYGVDLADPNHAVTLCARELSRVDEHAEGEAEEEGHEDQTPEEEGQEDQVHGQDALGGRAHQAAIARKVVEAWHRHEGDPRLRAWVGVPQ